jgi:lysophospholipase L1-like esterase
MRRLNHSGRKKSLFSYYRDGALHFLHESLSAGQSYILPVVSDSTGNGSAKWLHKFAERMAAIYPDIGVAISHWRWPASATYHPHVVISAGSAGERRVSRANTAPGVCASFPASVQCPIGDIDISCDVSLSGWAGNEIIVSRFGDSGHRSFVFGTNPTGLQLAVQTGATGYVLYNSSVAHGFAAGTRNWVRVQLDVDDGSGGSVATFLTSADGETWTQLGIPVTKAHASPLDASPTTAWELLGRTSGLTMPTVGSIYQVVVRDGIDGAVILPTQPELWTLGARGVRAGSPVLHILAACQPGGTSEYWTDDDLMQLAFFGMSFPKIMIAMGHNLREHTGEQSKAQLAALVAMIQSKMTAPDFVFTSQNPQKAPTTEGQIAKQAERYAAMRAYAGANAWPYIDVFSKWRIDDPLLALVSEDGVHPIEAGYDMWADIILRDIQETVLV